MKGKPGTGGCPLGSKDPELSALLSEFLPSEPDPEEHDDTDCPSWPQQSEGFSSSSLLVKEIGY